MCELYESSTVADRITAIIKARGIQKNSMLAELGLSKNTFSAMKKGSMISAGSLALIADYLDCSVDFLLDRELKSNDQVKKKSAPSITDEASEIAIAFDKADQKSKDIVRVALAEYLARGKAGTRTA